MSFQMVAREPTKGTEIPVFSPPTSYTPHPLSPCNSLYDNPLNVFPGVLGAVPEKSIKPGPGPGPIHNLKPKSNKLPGKRGTLLWGLSPQQVRSDTISRQTVSELNERGECPAGVCCCLAHVVQVGNLIYTW